MPIEGRARVWAVMLIEDGGCERMSNVEHCISQDDLMETLSVEYYIILAI